MTPNRRRDTERQRTLAEARTHLTSFLQQCLGADVDSAVAQGLLHEADAWESRATVYALAAYVTSHPEALKAPSPHSPIAVLRLLRVLDAAGYGPQVTQLGCAVCGRTDVLLRCNSAEGRCCPMCAARSRLKTCSRCGQTRRVVTRDAVCRRCYAADPTRWEPCGGCGRSRPVHSRLDDGSALCERCAPRPERACVYCGRVTKGAKAQRGVGPVCRSCYTSEEAPRRPCGRCGRERPVHARSLNDQLDLCAYCYARARVGDCYICGRHREGNGKGSTFRCHACRPRRAALCCDCGRSRPVEATYPVGPLCGACYLRRRRHPVPCGTCGEIRVMVGRSQTGDDQCGPCSGADNLNVQCRRCGYPGDIYAGGSCTRCVVRERVQELLSRPDGTISPQLEPLVGALGGADDPWSVLAWTRAQRGARLLAQLAAQEHDITHAMLDVLPQDGAVRRVRAILVATGALPWRNENLAGLNLWFARTAEHLPTHLAQVIKPFAEWQIIRDARRRAARGRYSAGAAHADRLDVKAAIAFMTWLDERNLTLHSVTQHDLDLFLTTYPAKHRTLGAFLRWTIARRLTTGLVAPKRSSGRPSRFLTEQEQFDQLRRCLCDTGLPLEVRIIGAFVRLYAQQVSRVVEFTTDRYATHDNRAYFTFAHNPVLLPPTLATLVEQQIATPRLNDILAPTTNREFLFPGRPPSRPRSAASVLSLMRVNGLPILSARNTAMIEAVTELPPVVVSDLFGVTASTACRWGQLAGESWADYLACRRQS